MYCEHCGKETTDSAQFCEHCGKQISTLERPALAAFRKAIGPKHKNHKKGIILGILLFVILTAGITVMDYLSSCIDPTKYLTFDVSGFSTHGYVDIVFDPKDEMVMMILQDSIPTVEDEHISDDWAELARIFWLYEAKPEVMDLFYVYQESGINGEFSNGDTFNVVIEVDQEGLEAYGYHTLKDTYRVTYTIGKEIPAFAEPAEVNFFDYVELLLDGDDLTVANISETLVLTEPVNEIHSIEIETKPYYPDNKIIAVIRLKMLDKDGYKLYSGGIAVESSKMEDISSGDEIVLNFFEYEWVEEKGISITELEKNYNAKDLETVQ